MANLVHPLIEYKQVDGPLIYSNPFYVGQDIIACLISLQPGAAVPEHSHEHQSEIFDVIEGEGTFTLDGQPLTLKQGMTICVPANTRHSLQAGDHPWILRETVHQHIYVRQALKRAFQKRWRNFLHHFNKGGDRG